MLVEKKEKWVIEVEGCAVVFSFRDRLSAAEFIKPFIDSHSPAFADLEKGDEIVIVKATDA